MLVVVTWSQHYPAGVRHTLGQSCNRAVNSLRSIRERLRRRCQWTDVAAEQKSNFAPYSRKSKPIKQQSWAVKVVCLSNISACKVPCTVGERETLVAAGLGERKVLIPDIDCSWEEFKSTLISAFPKLKEGGGFDILRCIPNTKDLEIISLAVAQSPKLLKSVVANGRVFVRPIQQNLQLDPIVLSTTQVITNICVHCYHICSPSLISAKHSWGGGELSNVSLFQKPCHPHGIPYRVTCINILAD